MKTTGGRRRPGARGAFCRLAAKDTGPNHFRRVLIIIPALRQKSRGDAGADAEEKTENKGKKGAFLTNLLLQSGKVCAIM
jgi:hypothetical protein